MEGEGDLRRRFIGGGGRIYSIGRFSSAVLCGISTCVVLISQGFLIRGAGCCGLGGASRKRILHEIKRLLHYGGKLSTKTYNSRRGYGMYPIHGSVRGYFQRGKRFSPLRAPVELCVSRGVSGCISYVIYISKACLRLSRSSGILLAIHSIAHRGGVLSRLRRTEQGTR